MREQEFPRLARARAAARPDEGQTRPDPAAWVSSLGSGAENDTMLRFAPSAANSIDLTEANSSGVSQLLLGRRTRLSTLLAGVFLLALILVLGDVVGMIPMAALVAIMIMVSVGTIDWHSIRPRTLKLMPVSETVVMLVTVVATLATSNLAIGVVLGVLTAMIMFARRVAHLASVEKVAELDTDGDARIDTRTYRIHGQLFWASSNDLVYAFDYADSADNIVIDLSTAEVWDASTVATLDSITRKFEDRGKTVTITGLDGPSKDRLDRLTGQLP